MCSDYKGIQRNQQLLCNFLILRKRIRRRNFLWNLFISNILHTHREYQRLGVPHTAKQYLNFSWQTLVELDDANTAIQVIPLGHLRISSEDSLNVRIFARNVTFGRKLGPQRIAQLKTNIQKWGQHLLCTPFMALK